MIDIHSHLLHALDDGSKTLENSVEMARMAAADGITHMVCTPHASGAYAFSPEIVQSHLAELRSAVAAENIALHIGSGCDFHLSFDNIEDAYKHPHRYTINAHDYLLVELPDYGIPATISDVLYQLRLLGMIPILTHPERNATLSGNLDRLAEWMRSGLLIQVTANSITGGMGRGPQKAALDLLRRGWVHFVATDAHNLTSRPPILSEAYAAVARNQGQAIAQKLFVENPMAVWNGEALPASLAHEPEEEYAAPHPHRPSIWQRLFGAGSH